MGEVASNLPPQLRHGRALEQAFRDSRENLRALMEEAARRDLAARLTEFLPQKFYVHIHGTALPFKVKPPYNLHNTVAGKHNAFVF